MEHQTPIIGGPNNKVDVLPTNTLVSTSTYKQHNTIAGRLAQFVTKWQTITSDKWVLDTIKHYHIEFTKLPIQLFQPKRIPFIAREIEMISAEVHKLLQKGAIKQVEHTSGEFISNIFIRPKKDRSFRPIINLRELNKSVAYFHFKIETNQFALELIRPKCYMASIDLKDAYFAIPIAVEHRKFLRFLWQHNLFEFTCLPFCLSMCPKGFHKGNETFNCTPKTKGS